MVSPTSPGLPRGSIQPVCIAYHTRRWTEVAIGSFLEQLPDFTVLAVDNNPERDEPGWHPDCDAERAFLVEHPRVQVIRAEHGRTHGAGMNVALQYCRDVGMDYLLHFEPDCLITGTRWFTLLSEAVAGGASMAGSHRKEYGPIHPTPSLWRVADVQASFDAQPRGADLDHPRFHELVDAEALDRLVGDDPTSQAWWSSHWDTAQKNWFDAAVRDAAVLVADTGDFEHFWYGSQAGGDLPLDAEPRLAHYLAQRTDGNEGGQGAPNWS